MKKFLVCFMAAIVLSMGIIPVFADESAQITLNGELCDIPEGYGRVFVQDNRTFVPVRFVTEKLGCAVTWDEEDQLVVISTGDMSDFFFLQVGNKNMLHQKIGAASAEPMITMDVATYYDETEWRTYIPVRFLAEALGYTVDWDQATGTVSLVKAE